MLNFLRKVKSKLNLKRYQNKINFKTQKHNDLQVTVEHIKSFNFNIHYLLDIGIHEGTPTLYQAFNTAKIIAVDPRIECKYFLDKWKSIGYDIKFIQVAASSEEGVKNLNILGGEGGSGFVERTKKVKVKEQRSVELKTLDRILDDNDIKGKIGIKVDVEGHEKEVLLGAKNTLLQAEFVVIEVPIKQNFSNDILASDLILFMKEQGFEIYDNWGKARQPTNNWDLVFVPRNKVTQSINT